MIAAALVDGVDAAIAAAPVTDTDQAGRGEGGRAERRARDARPLGLWAVQTPQVFRRAALERALDVPDEVLAQATDDAWLVERAGGRVVVVEAPRENLKVTTPLDLALAELLDRSPALTHRLSTGELPARIATICSPTTTSTYAPTSSTRPRPSTSRPPTWSATARSPTSAGSPSWASPSTSTASARRSRCGSTRLWREFAHDDLDEYCGFVREETDLRLGIEADFIPGGEDRMANLLEAHDFDYVVGSVHFLRDESLDMEEYSVWSTTRSAEEIWRRYFQTLGEAARSGLFDILAHPDLVKVWGPDRPRPGGRPAPLLRAGDRGHRGVGDRGGGLHGGPAQARPGDLPRAGVPRDVRGSRRAGRALQRRPPSRRTWGPTTSRRSSCWSAWACASCACSSAARGAWSRSARDRAMSLSGIGYDCHRFAAGGD